MKTMPEVCGTGNPESADYLVGMQVDHAFVSSSGRKVDRLTAEEVEAMIDQIECNSPVVEGSYRWRLLNTWRFVLKNLKR